MDDNEIISLYWNRSETAIEQTAAKYGRLLYSVAVAHPAQPGRYRRMRQRYLSGFLAGDSSSKAPGPVGVPLPHHTQPGLGRNMTTSMRRKEIHRWPSLFPNWMKSLPQMTRSTKMPQKKYCLIASTVSLKHWIYISGTFSSGVTGILIQSDQGNHGTVQDEPEQGRVDAVPDTQ